MPDMDQTGTISNSFNGPVTLTQRSAEYANGRDSRDYDHRPMRRSNDYYDAPPASWSPGATILAIVLVLIAVSAFVALSSGALCTTDVCQASWHEQIEADKSARLARASADEAARKLQAETDKAEADLRLEKLRAEPDPLSVEQLKINADVAKAVSHDAASIEIAKAQAVASQHLPTIIERMISDPVESPAVSPFRGLLGGSRPAIAHDFGDGSCRLSTGERGVARNGRCWRR
jgi:hypothetical protein